MNHRKGVSPVIATVILLAMTLVVALTSGALIRNTASSGTSYESIETTHTYCTLDTDVNLAKWKIEAHIINRGTQSVTISSVGVLEKEVDTYGVSIGDSLNDGYEIGTNLPLDGLRLGSGEGADIIVWVGDQLFSSGTTIVIHLRHNSASTSTFVQLI